MKRILIISTFFPPLNSIASLRPYSWAKEWTQMGHSVTVLTTKKLQTENPLNFDLTGIEIVEVESSLNVSGLKKNYHEQKVKGKPSFLHRMMHQLKYKYGLFNACRMPDFTDFWIYPALKQISCHEKFDFIVSTSGPYSVHILGYLLKRKELTNKWIADYRDTWSNNYIYPGLFPFNFFEKYLEKFLLRKVDLITTVSEPFKEYFEKTYKKETRVVYNGFNPEDVDLEEGTSYPLSDKFRIVHTGSIYKDKRDPIPLFKAINELSDNPLIGHLEVIFIGSELADLQELIDLYHVEKHVKIQGFLSRKETLSLQRNADVLLFLPWNDPKVDGILTGKIFEYLYSKTPIISIGCPHMEASQKLIDHYKAGISLHSVDEIVTYLKRVLMEKPNAKTNVTNNELFLFDRRMIAKDFLNSLLILQK